MSISLWDLHQLGGLSIRGAMYDEVVPNAQELAGNMRDKNFLLPVSYKYLFLVYHRLCKESKKNVVRITN